MTLASQINYGNVVSGSAARPTGVNATYVYARWTGFLVPSVSGKYTLGVNSSDGANLFISNSGLVLNLAATQTANGTAAYKQSASIQLTAGVYYPISVEWQHGAGSPYEIQLLWTPPTGSVALIPAANLSTSAASVTSNLAGSWWNGTAGMWYPTGAGLIDFANPSIPNKTAANITYTGGSTVDSLQPAQAGADITSQNGDILLQNPNFAAGNVGWGLQPAWSIIAGTPVVPGSSFVASWLSSTAATSAIVNAQHISCAAGSVVSASCYLMGATGATVNRSTIRISAYAADGTLIQIFEGNPVTAHDATWYQSRAVIAMPATTAYCTIDAAVFTGSGQWYACGFSASILANSIAEVPDDPTGVYVKPVGVNSSGQITTPSIVTGAVSSSLSYYSASAVSLTTGTLVLLASVTIPTDGGFVEIRANLQILLTNSIVDFYIYKGTSAGTLLTEAINLYVSAAATIVVTTTQSLAAIDTSPGSSQTYTLYGKYTGTGTVQAQFITLTTLNLKV